MCTYSRITLTLSCQQLLSHMFTRSLIWPHLHKGISLSCVQANQPPSSAKPVVAKSYIWMICIAKCVQAMIVFFVLCILFCEGEVGGVVLPSIKAGVLSLDKGPDEWSFCENMTASPHLHLGNVTAKAASRYK